MDYLYYTERTLMVRLYYGRQSHLHISVVLLPIGLSDCGSTLLVCRVLLCCIGLCLEHIAIQYADLPRYQIGEQELLVRVIA